MDEAIARGPVTKGVTRGLMQDWPLTVDRFLEHARAVHGHREVVSRHANGEIARKTYAEVHAAAKRVSAALLAYGIGLGDMVATLAMNSAEHMETWYGICGIGAVCHTLNPRVFREQLVYIVNHAGERLIFADGAFAPLLADVLPACPSVEQVVFLSPPEGETPAVPWTRYEDFLDGHGPDAPWGDFDESAAAGLCYTSGTTGDPKGVLYSHRSNYLQGIVNLQPDVFGLSVRDVILPAVPLYHANAWAVVFSAPAVGAKLAMPGPRLDGASLFGLMEAEGVTIALGVPSVWSTLLEDVRAGGRRFSTLKRVIVGGAACPEDILRGFEALGVEAIPAWGMTELSPVGTSSTPTPATAALEPEAQMRVRLKQGRPPCGVELRLKGADGTPAPWDGLTAGTLTVRGHSVAAAYFGADQPALDAEGFFDTGDIATIDAEGFMEVTDRAKDLIKSGGEWISSQDIERAALRRPDVAAAAAVGVPHPRWGERPVLLVQPRPGAEIDLPALRESLGQHLARWAVPEEVRLTDSLPLGATGKVDKKALRARLAAERIAQDEKT